MVRSLINGGFCAEHPRCMATSDIRWGFKRFCEPGTFPPKTESPSTTDGGENGGFDTLPNRPLLVMARIFDAIEGTNT